MNQATLNPASEASTAQPEASHHGLIYRAVVYGTRLPPARRRRLYLLVLGISLTLVWAPISALLLLKPARFTSEWTLIMPGAGSGHAVNLDSIGQATANVASPFTNSSIDPLVNYREIATSMPVLAKAAGQVGLSAQGFGKPRIKLVDQTALMHFQVKGASAEQARDKSLALYAALQEQLEVLRNDEVSRITRSSLSTIEDFSDKLEQTQREKLHYQNQNSILSVDQFNQLVQRLEEERALIDTLAAQRDALQARAEALLDSIGLNATQVRHAVTLRNDTLFQSHLRRHADLHAQSDTVDATWGDRHPRLNQLQAAHDSINEALVSRGRRLAGNSRLSAAALIDLGSNEIENPLLQELIQYQAQQRGIDSELARRQQALATLVLRIEESADDAIKLEELSRKQQVATAVFSTALAKQDIGKVDRFASYPLLQMLAEPTLPERPDQLHVKLALAGGGAATLFILSGLLVLWLRKPLLQQMLKSA